MISYGADSEPSYMNSGAVMQLTQRWSSQYEAKHRARLAWHYTAVESPKKNGVGMLVHITEAGTIGAVARGVIKGAQKTLCGQRIHGEWKVMPRDEDRHGFLISCATCRSRMSNVIVHEEDNT